MRISKTLKQIIKKDGKHSVSARRVSKLRSSKEFNYLIDSTGA
jgi:hypothetical protein